MGKSKKAESKEHAIEGTPEPRKRYAIFEKINREIERAYEIHGCPRWGRHEAYAIIKEEFDEVWEAIRADEDHPVLAKELVQVAAMCIRYLETEPRFILATTEQIHRMLEDG